MNIEVKSYNQQFTGSGKLVLDSDLVNNHPLNKYGLQVVAANAALGETYWKVIGIHHLLPTENRGDHHVYLEALDETGNRIHEPLVWATSQFGSIREPVKLEKPAGEPAGNIPMYAGNTYAASIRGLSLNAADKSDRVERLHTNHPDEQLPPDGLGGNTNGHHSFYVVFQRTKNTGVGADPEPVNFLQYALDHGLGNGVTPKFEFQQHQLQVFELGVVFAKNESPTVIQHQLW